MNEVPPRVLNAALHALYHATVFSRNFVRAKHGTEAVYQIMDAVHEVPQILLHWGTSDNNEEKLRAYFGYFDSKHIQELDDDSMAPDLVALFDEKLREE
jgi:hypothetical protein